jgi:NAD(P)-dependent dehydrogenase (short-subunit alcohol dehydrogenase family)
VCSSLGRHAIVEELAGFGARVHTCARNAAELEACRRRWAEKGLNVTVSVCDVSVGADREKLVATVKGTFGGKLDILVSNLRHSPVISYVNVTRKKHRDLCMRAGEQRGAVAV